MSMDGLRYSIERQKLCAWLEAERSRLAPSPDRDARVAELEREFRTRLDKLYLQARAQLEPDAGR